MTAIETNNNVADSDNVIHYVRTAFPINTLNQLYSDKQLCDVQVKIGNHHYDCHRIILAASSAYFLAMFTSNLNESRQTIVEIKEADQEAIAILIDYFYTGKIEINTNNVQSIAVTSSMLGVDEIVNECCHFISNLLVASNCLEIRSFAEFHHFEALGEAADQFIANHFSEIIETDSFVQMPYDYLINILPKPYLKVSQEIDVFNAMMKWVKYDLKGRGDKLPELLNCIRLALIPVETLIARVESEELIVDELQCQIHLHRAKNFRFMPERFFSAKTQPRQYHATKLLTVEQQRYQNLTVYCDESSESNAIFSNPFHRTQYAILTLGKKLFFFGGRPIDNNNYDQRQYDYDYGSRHNRRYSATTIGSTNTFTVVPSLDLSTKMWKEESSFNNLPISVYAHQLCQLDETIYLIGGILNDEKTPVGTHPPIASLYCYHNGIWSEKSSMHQARANFGAVVHQDRLYVVGGRIENRHNVVVIVTATMEIYDPKEDKWTIGKSINEAREGCGLVSLVGQLYVLGGYNGNNTLSSVERYDERSQEWVQVSSMLNYRSHGHYIAHKGKIWAYGGANPNMSINNLITFNYMPQNQPYYKNLIETYDPVKNQWESYSNRSSSTGLCHVVNIPED